MENSSHFLLAFLLKEKCRLAKMIPKSDLLFNTIISIQLDIHFCICFLFVLVFPSVCLPLHLSGTEATQASVVVQWLQRGPMEERLWSLATALSSPGKASGDGSLYSLRSDAEVLCRLHKCFPPRNSIHFNC